MSTTNNKPKGSGKSAVRQQPSNQATMQQTNRSINNMPRNKQASFPKNGNIPSLQLHPITTGWSGGIINAPTSLTNLAQLSGISLLPMNNIASVGQLSSRHPPIANQSAHQSNLPNRNNAHIISISNSLEALQYVDRLPVNPNQITSSTRNPSLQQGNYNLSGHPATTQLLSQATISSSKVSHWSSTPIEHQSMPQAQQKPTKKVDRAKKTKPRPKSNNIDTRHNLNDRSQVIPAPDSKQVYPKPTNFSTNQANGPHVDLTSHHSIESISSNKSVDFPGDLNNISLMKLMAILNNPALTITPVNPRDNFKVAHESSSIVDNHLFNPPINYLEGQQMASTSMHNPINANQAKVGHSFVDYPNVQTKTSSKTRLPQSAANLQIVHRGSSEQTLQSQLNNSTAINSGSQSINCNEIDQNQQDFQFDWLSNYNPIGSTATSKNRTKSWVNQSQNPSSMINKHSSFHLDKVDDSLLSTSVRNLLMQQQPSNSKQPTVSAQMLKHIANQAQDNNNWDVEPEHKSILEPECILSSPPVQLIQNSAKRTEVTANVTSSVVLDKEIKPRLQTTKDRLYVPRSQSGSSKSDSKFTLSDIRIDTEEREVHLSDRHFMLDSMMPDLERRESINVMSEPDEIFVNRSKRVMSKIDTMLERKKRRRFERISGRAAPKTNSLEEQYAESEEEWSEDEPMDVGSSTFITTHLPLDEPESPEKKSHLEAVGLISRAKRNRILLEQYEERAKIFCPLKFEQPRVVSSDLERFVNTMVVTGGVDVQMRVESNIKRNDLPLLEGLNRNTSRQKMAFMGALGLEKRSKRTTLYKMKPACENHSTPLPKSDDLINKTKPVDQERKKIVETIPRHSIAPVISPVIMADRTSTKLAKLTLINCRDAIKPPNKDEYMKSLGLMAS